jgi:hypothetical protein
LILPITTGWAPFLVDGRLEAGSVADIVAQQNTGILLHHAYAEDHGLRVVVLEGTRESFTIDLQRRGPSELDLARISTETVRLRLTPDDRQLQALLVSASREGLLDLEEARRVLSEAFALKVPEWLGCADLSNQSERNLLKRFPDAQLVLKSLRGRSDKDRTMEPNEWCPTPGQLSFLYLPVPTGPVDSAKLELHVQHWLSTGDFDVERQAGFWMLTAYQRALPSRYFYLADRVMNLTMLFPEQYEAMLRQTLRGILAVSPSNFDWEPYLARQAGEQRL